MKRSEMVELLKGYVFSATEGEAEIDLEDAELLLQFIEQAGMLPPSRYHNESFAEVVARAMVRDKSLCDDESDEYDDYTWEVE